MYFVSVSYVLVFILGFGGIFSDKSDFTIIMSAIPKNEAYQRFLRSARIYGVKVKTIELEENVQCGSNNDHCARDGLENTLLLPMRKMLKEIIYNGDGVVFVANSPNVILNSRQNSIMEKFKKFQAEVIFSADSICSSDNSLKLQQSKIKQGKKCLNSAGFMGYASTIYHMLNEHLIQYSGDDQLFFAEIYLNDILRKKYKIKIDHKSELLQILNTEEEIKIKYYNKDAYFVNNQTKTIPSIIISSDHNPSLIDIVGDYLARSYNPHAGCLQCQENTIELNNLNAEDFPVVLIAIFILKPTPFFEEFLKHFNHLYYPKNKIHLFIHLGHNYNQKDIEKHLKTYRKLYLSVKYNGLKQHVKEGEAKTEAVNLCKEKKCDYYLNLDSTVHFVNPHALQQLIEQNRSVVAPILSGTNYKHATSNFWRAMTRQWKGMEAFDCNSIITWRIRGLWTVASIASVYLIHSRLLRSNNEDINFYSPDMDADMTFCQNIRRKNVLLYASNRVFFGYWVSVKSFNTSHIHNEMYDLPNNNVLWEQRYITEDYYKYRQAIKQTEEPCPGVYRFPLFTSRFCSELINIMKHHGKWSTPHLKDGGFSKARRTYATDHIHMSAVGLSGKWRQDFQQYLLFFRHKIFPQYRKYPESHATFVARYTPKELSELDPHEDDSDYSINVALNRQGIDYQGGGTRFTKNKCSVTSLKAGWVLMHPGDLQHEGLKTTNGTRYIFVSFVRVHKS